MIKAQNLIAAWADTVAPDRTVFDAAAKLVMEEIPELMIDLKQDGKPSEEEVADVLILALDIASLCGYDADSIVANKMAINKGRKWEITNGMLQHI